MEKKFSAIPRSGLGAEKGYTTSNPTSIGSAQLITHYHFSDVEILLLVLLYKGYARADSNISITHTALLPPLDLCPSLPSCHKLGSLEMNTLMEFCRNIFVRDQHLLKKKEEVKSEMKKGKRWTSVQFPQSYSSRIWEPWSKYRPSEWPALGRSGQLQRQRHDLIPPKHRDGSWPSWELEAAWWPNSPHTV